ncbi:hypothetical protein CNMCM8927_000232 [Aspergillus lentulus]|uniref:Uncharacterized protein n=1 Tax=Aspergillus lentulus TaxID=293939 RepID=A0AAN5YJB8_ASPLE|nr:hypothetical protein CNMCM8927_000232 [Aspergillus lentulus]
MDQYPITSLYSIAEEATRQDRGILCGGGTSSNPERLPSRLQRSKTTSRSMKKEIGDLVYEALLQLQEQMYRLFHRTEDALIQVTACLQEAEQRYLALWGMTPNANIEGVI